MTDTDSFLKKMAKGIEKVHNVRFEEQKDGLGEADWKTSTFQPKTDAIIAAIKSGDVVLKSPEDSMCEEIDALTQRVKVLEVGFQNVLNVLGPNVPSDLKGCPGCQEEWAEAIRIAEETLAPPVGEKEKPRA